MFLVHRAEPTSPNHHVQAPGWLWRGGTGSSHALPHCSVGLVVPVGLQPAHALLSGVMGPVRGHPAGKTHLAERAVLVSCQAASIPVGSPMWVDPSEANPPMSLVCCV